MILITGGFGLVGTLLRTNSEVYKDADIYDIANDPTQDILDYGNLFRTFKKTNYDAVVHLAEIPLKSAETLGESRKNYRVNLDAMQNLNRIARLSGTRLVYCLKSNTTPTTERIDFIAQHRLQTASAPVVFVELPDIIPTINVDGEVEGNGVVSNILRAARAGETFLLNKQGGDLIELANIQDVIKTFEQAVSGDTSNKETLKVSSVYSLSVAALIAFIKEGYPDANIQYEGDVVEPEVLGDDIRKFLADLHPTQAIEGWVVDSDELSTGSENPKAL